MTLGYLKKRIAYFEGRMQMAKTKGAKTLARNKYRQSKRMLACLQATGNISNWTDFKLGDEA